MPSFIEHRRRSEQALISVIQEVVKGVSTRKIEAVLRGGLPAPAALSATSTNIDKLQKRQTGQKVMLKLIAKGLSNREIANVVRLSERVVKSEVSSLLALYDVTNRTELATLAESA